MNHKLRILFLEDRPEDVELIERELIDGGLVYTSKRVETREAFSKEIHEFQPDLIIADFSLPSFTGLEAIGIVQEQAPEIPVIVCTGSISEDVAVECIKAGAADYVIKENIARLSFAARGALERKQAREEKEKAERALREEHAYVRNLINSSLDMIIAVDAKRRITEFNEAAEKAFGYGREEVIGKHVNLLYADQKEGLAVHKKTVDDGHHVQEVLNLRKDGETFTSLLSSSVLRDANGGVIGVMGVSRDITLQKQDEELLQFQADVLANVQDSVIVTDLDGEIIYWNSGATEVYGHQAEDMIGKSPALLYPDLDPNKLAADLESGAQGYGLTGLWRAIHKDGSDIWVAMKTTTARDAAGNLIGHIWISRDMTKRKQAEEELAREQHLFRTLMDNVPDNIYFKDHESRFIRCSKSVSDRFGLSDPSQAVGMSDFDFFTEEHARPAYEDEQEVIRSGKPLIKEEKETWPDGRETWALSVKLPFRDKGGNIIGTFGISKDITEHKLAEEALRVSEEKYRTFFEYDLSGDYLATPEGQLIDCNPAFLKVFGLSSLDEAREIRMESLYPTLADRRKILAKIEQEKVITDCEHEMRKVNGETIVISRNDVGEFDEHGKLIMVRGYIIDITERRRTEEKLRLSDQIISHINNIVLVVDDEGNVIFASPSVTEMLGYSVTEVLGNGWWELTHRSEEEREIERTYVIRAARDRRNINSKPYERKVYSKDGQPHWILWQDAAGPGKSVIGIGHDISEYKKLESHLNQAEKLRAIGELAAGIAHEINSPIQYIGDNLRFIEDTSEKIIYLLNKQASEQKVTDGAGYSEDQIDDAMQLSSEDIDYLTDEIPLAIRQSLEGVARVSEIVQAMKSFSHPGGEEKTPLDLNQIIQDTITVARNEWKYVADVVPDLVSDLPLVPCLSGELKQVVLNLIVNAAHAIEEANKDKTTVEKGVISISTRCEGDDVEIRIGDTGTGIPENIRDRIFEPFFTTKEVGRGTGQGLTIAHSVIVEKHGGTITFESKEGKGTTFIIRLPISAVPA